MGQIVTVNFRGDTLYGFENDDGVFVALKPMVESMGMDWSAQFRRVKRDPILSEGIAIMATPFGRGGDQECVCLKLELVNGWLFTIDASRVQDEAVRDKVILYQREGYGVLFRHFYGRSAAERVAGTPTTEALPGGRATEKDPVRVRRQLVSEARQTFGMQAARELWFKLGLDTVPAMFTPVAQHEMFISYATIRRDAEEVA